MNNPSGEPPGSAFAGGEQPGFTFASGERASLPERLNRHRHELSQLVIAIDGPAGSGKSTTAQAVARRLGLRYADSGALYRALTLSALREGIGSDDAAALRRLAGTARIRVTSTGGSARVWLGDEDVSEAVRAPEVASAVSRVSAHAQVRAAMLEQQRELARSSGIVMDGRDIGSIVLPDADLKLFLTAEVGTRARRRQAEEAARGLERELAVIEREIASRDHADSTRSSAPLLCAPDAIRIDTTRLDFEEQVDAVLALALRFVEARALESRAPDSGSGPGAAGGPLPEPRDWAQPGYRKFRHVRYRLVALSLGRLIRMYFGMNREIHPAALVGGSVLLASNHVSALDPPLVGAALPFEVYFVAKRELFRKPLLGSFIRAFNAFPIQRGTADFAALDHAVELLGGGKSVLMFPEGTRQRPGRLGRPRWGFGYVAVRAGRPVIPMFVRGTRDLRPRGLRREPFEVWVGEPVRFDPRPRDDQEGYLRAAEIVMESIAGLMLRSAARRELPGLDLPGPWASRAVESGP